MDKESCSCTYCLKEKTCKFAFVTEECRVTTIKESKQIVDKEFLQFLLKLQQANKVICSDNVRNIINAMQIVFVDSAIDLEE